MHITLKGLIVDARIPSLDTC